MSRWFWYFSIVILSKVITDDFGIFLSRSCAVINNAASFEIDMTGHHCSKRDKYGDDVCKYDWGEDVQGNVSLYIPTVEIQAQDYMIGNLFFERFIPFHFQCPLCGQDCVLHASIIDLNWTIAMPKHCPINVAEHPQIYPFLYNLPPTSPTKGIVPVGLEGTVKVIQGSSTGKTLVDLSIKLTVK